MNLPKKGTSNKEVYLPDNSKLKASHTTQLPFKQLSHKAREADILPGLKTPLISVSKMAEEGYTTIFHPGEKGVTIQEPGSVSIIAKTPPVLQGCKSKGAKLWTISNNDDSMKERANNVYDLPSINQTVKCLHAAARFPMKETWLKAIKAGNFAMWPTINPSIVRRHFPKLDETAKGHMKKQCQGVRSTRELEDSETNSPTIPKAKDIYIKVHNATETIHTDQTGLFPAISSKGNQYIMILVEVDGNFIDAEPIKKSQKD